MVWMGSWRHTSKPKTSLQDVDINQLILEFIERGERPGTAYMILMRKNGVRGLTRLAFRTSYKAAVIMPG